MPFLIQFSLQVKWIGLLVYQSIASTEVIC